MSLLHTIKPEDATGQVAQNYAPFLERLGKVPAPFMLYSVSPDLQSHMLRTMGYFMQHPRLSPGLLALIRLLVAEELNYNYCVSLNRDILKAIGIANDDQLGAILADPDQAPVSEKDRVLLKLAYTACTKPEAVDEAQVRAARDQGWTDGDILDATVHGLAMVQGGILERAFGLADGAAC